MFDHKYQDSINTSYDEKRGAKGNWKEEEEKEEEEQEEEEQQQQKQQQQQQQKTAK